ncbi:MarR family winged helix-turn-helix transcriptional regulator [Cohnella rhizosphaerae]|uniref:MarR family transcriptional regulator n=1 Tax=Cohnella rhizosphaerae TaxID=1457232 RepID=A0A9X4QVH6_9BACL|nr:MarR family transcriptional regulator [Cohnella rhizosphaerae]MDG0812624.1 MarR family transcriptional regulator [Cohnella rhizosphaerae]
MRPYTVGRLMSLINRISQRELAEKLKPHDIGSGGQHSYLRAILATPGMNQDKLTNVVKFDKATTTRCIRQLEEAGYVTRTVDEQDRRSYRLFPTERAISFEPTLQAILDDYNRLLTARLTADEIETLQALLQKMYLGLDTSALNLDE